MIRKYFVKLDSINGEKLETDQVGFFNLNEGFGGDYIICYGDNGTKLYVLKNRILLSYMIDFETEQQTEEDIEE